MSLLQPQYCLVIKILQHWNHSRLFISCFLWFYTLLVLIVSLFALPFFSIPIFSSWPKIYYRKSLVLNPYLLFTVIQKPHSLGWMALSYCFRFICLQVTSLLSSISSVCMWDVFIWMPFCPFESIFVPQVAAPLDFFNF